MPPEEEFRSESGPVESPATSQPEHRRRRSGRGRRGRGRRPSPKPLPPPSGSAPGDQAEPPPSEHLDASPEMEPVPPVSEPAMAAPVSHPVPAASPAIEESESAPPATIQDAIERVNDVIEKLRQSLDEMEEVFELLETLERQSTGDQQEIESLRRALRQFQRPREGHRGPR